MTPGGTSSGAGDTTWKCVRYEATAGVAIVTLDRPDRGNAWTGRMELEYRRALSLAEDDPAVGAIVITGAGRQFCVGADRSAMAGISAAAKYDSGVREPLPEPGDPGHGAHSTRHGFLLSLRKPVIAAVNGAAAGVGFVIMCFADVRFVDETAKLTTSTSRLGLPAEFGLAWILPRLVGASRAAPLLLGSPVITGQEAATIGLAHQACASGDTLSEAVTYARRLVVENAPSSLQIIKRQLWTDLSASLSESDAQATTAMQLMVAGEDFAEAMAALAERRAPAYR